MQPDAERRPLARLPGAIALAPPMDFNEIVPFEQQFLRAPLFLPPAFASTPTSGAVGVSSDCRVTGYRRLSSSARNALPALAGSIRLLAYVPWPYRRVAYPQQYPFLLRIILHSLCAAQYSIHFLILSHILSLVYILMSIAGATSPRCASLSTLHGWRFPLL